MSFDPTKDTQFSSLAFHGFSDSEAVAELTEAMKSVVPKEHRHRVKFDSKPTVLEVGLVRSCHFKGQTVM